MRVDSLDKEQGGGQCSWGEGDSMTSDGARAQFSSALGYHLGPRGQK